MHGDDPDGSVELQLPVWARDKAFPPAGDGYGWLDRKRGRHTCSSLEDLAKTIREDKGSAVDLVWTPESANCRVPEEVEALAEPILEVRKRWAADDMADANHRMKWFAIFLGGFIAYMVYLNLGQVKDLDIPGWKKCQLMLEMLSRSTYIGMALLGFLIFAFIPWYQVHKRVREMKKGGSASVALIPLLRFETWLDWQKAPVTYVMLGIISIVALAQMWFDGSIISFGESVQEAGLVEMKYVAGEWTRLFTAPMLHGGIIHFVMNALALLYLGKRVEVFARWPHVAMVFLFSALVGGEASMRFMENAISVGASGGLMGWLGFLLVFETLHSQLVPKSARRRLIGGVVMTALIGLVGYRFIDNAAHFGGLVAGMAYAGIVFPKSASVIRPKVTLTDRVIGIACMFVILISAMYAIMKIAA